VEAPQLTELFMGGVTDRHNQIVAAYHLLEVARSPRPDVRAVPTGDRDRSGMHPFGRPRPGGFRTLR
jgi:hypothetical protein